jgi:hypothetical protein
VTSWLDAAKAEPTGESFDGNSDVFSPEDIESNKAGVSIRGLRPRLWRRRE